MICRLYVALLLSCAGSQSTTHGAAMPLQRAVTAGTSRMPGTSTLIPTVRSSYNAALCSQLRSRCWFQCAPADFHYSGVARAFVQAIVGPKLHLRDTRELEHARTRRDAVLRLGWNLGRVQARLQSMHAFRPSASVQPQSLLCGAVVYTAAALLHHRQSKHARRDRACAWSSASIVTQRSVIPSPACACAARQHVPDDEARHRRPARHRRWRRRRRRRLPGEDAV